MSRIAPRGIAVVTLIIPFFGLLHRSQSAMKICMKILDILKYLCDSRIIMRNCPENGSSAACDRIRDIVMSFVLFRSYMRFWVGFLCKNHGIRQAHDEDRGLLCRLFLHRLASGLRMHWVEDTGMCTVSIDHGHRKYYTNEFCWPPFCEPRSIKVASAGPNAWVP